MYLCMISRTSARSLYTVRFVYIKLAIAALDSVHSRMCMNILNSANTEVIFLRSRPGRATLPSKCLSTSTVN